MARDGAVITVAVPARREYLGLLRMAVQGLAEHYAEAPLRPSPSAVYAWALAVHEAAANVVLHAHGGGSSALLTLSIEPTADRVVFRLEDGGAAHPGWPRAARRSAWSERGRGTAVIRDVMAEVSYQRTAQGRNLLRLVAYLEPMGRGVPCRTATTTP